VSCYVQRPERAYRNEHSNQHHFGARAGFQHDCRTEIRGGGTPYSNMALMPTRENGPAARSFAADAYDCIMVRIKRSYRIQVCGTKMRSHGELPSDPQQTDTQVPSRHRTYTKSPVAVHRRYACSDVKALRNTSAARRQAAKLCYRFGPLTPSARSANLIAGDGTKNGFPAPNKEPKQTKNYCLTGKAPYRFESDLLQRRVCELAARTSPLGCG